MTKFPPNLVTVIIPYHNVLLIITKSTKDWVECVYIVSAKLNMKNTQPLGILATSWQIKETQEDLLNLMVTFG